MRKISILECYIGKIIFITTMMVLFVLVSLSGIIKFVDQLKKVGKGSYDAMGAGIYTLLSLPKDIQIFFPMAALIGSLLGLGILAQRGELVVMQSSGFTRMQIVFSVMKISIPLSLLTMVIGEWIAPRGEQIARNYRAKAIYGSLLISAKHELWVKDGDSFIYIEHVKLDHELNGVNIYKFDHNRRLISIFYAESAKFDVNKKLWNLSQIRETSLENLKQISSSIKVCSTWETNLTPDKLDAAALDPDALSIGGLYNYVKYLKSSDQDSRRYRLSMWSKIFQPISISIMILMGVSFSFGPLHRTSTGKRMIAGIIFGFLFYMFNLVFRSLTPVYCIPPIISTLFPSMCFLLISLRLLLKRF